jgi:hypothetical protein
VEDNSVRISEKNLSSALLWYVKDSLKNEKIRGNTHQGYVIYITKMGGGGGAKTAAWSYKPPNKN